MFFNRDASSPPQSCIQKLTPGLEFPHPEPPLSLYTHLTRAILNP